MNEIIDILTRVGNAIESQMACDDNSPDNLAHAALIAMCEPTRAMIEAAINRNCDVEGEVLYASIWRAMITAAGGRVEKP